MRALDGDISGSLIVAKGAREHGRDRLLKAAVTLFQSASYGEVSVGDILALAELPKGSFYHHFPGGKEEIACAAIAAIDQDVASFLAGYARLQASPRTVVLALTDLVANWLKETDYQQGALIVSLTAGRPPEAVALALQQANAGWLFALAAFGQDDPQAHVKARLALTTFEGAIQHARLHKDADLLREIIEEMCNSMPLA